MERAQDDDATTPMWAPLCPLGNIPYSTAEPFALMRGIRSTEVEMHGHTNCHSFDELDVAALWSSSAQIGGCSLHEVQAGMVPSRAPDRMEENENGVWRGDRRRSS